MTHFSMKNKQNFNWGKFKVLHLHLRMYSLITLGVQVRETYNTEVPEDRSENTPVVRREEGGTSTNKINKEKKEIKDRMRERQREKE